MGTMLRVWVTGNQNTGDLVTGELTVTSSHPASLCPKTVLQMWVLTYPSQLGFLCRDPAGPRSPPPTPQSAAPFDGSS